MTKLLIALLILTSACTATAVTIRNKSKDDVVVEITSEGSTVSKQIPAKGQIEYSLADRANINVFFRPKGKVERTISKVQDNDEVTITGSSSSNSLSVEK